MRETEGHIPSLDGLRGVSILLVIFSHAVGTRYFLGQEQVGPLLYLGELGVRVFFVISGFLITTLLLREVGRTGRIDIGKFYFRRVLRIFPAYYALLGVLVVLDIWGVIALAPGDAIRAMTYTSNYFPDRSWYVGHTWSLAVEEQFYLLWPAVLAVAGVRIGMLSAGSLILLCPLVRLAIWQYAPVESSGVGQRFETIADTIATGCLLAGFRDRLEASALYRRALDSRWMAVVPLAVVLASFAQNHPRMDFAVAFTVMNVGIALCVHWCLLNTEGRVGALLNGRVLATIGTLSYSLYLWQQVFLNRSSSSPLAAAPLSFVLVAAAAVVSYYTVERPFLRWRPALERRLYRRSEPAAAEMRAGTAGA